MIYQFIAAVVLLTLSVQPPPVPKTFVAVRYLIDIEHRRESKHYPHPLDNKPDVVAQIATGLDVSAVKYDVPALLLAAMTWKESRYRPDIIAGEIRGKLGELGLGQIHGVLARGCDMSGIPGQLDCTARGLRMSIDACGDSVHRGLNMYATGRCNVKRNTKAHRRINSRLRLWRKLIGVVDGR